MAQQLMFRSFGDPSVDDKKGADWGEDLVSAVASKTITHLFTKSESVQVSVRCQPSSKLLQGTVDSFKMSGRGLVIRQHFRTEEMWFETDAVSLDFSAILSGKIDLRQPTQAIAQVTLLETDINKSFQAPLVKQRLENLTDENLTNLSGGEPVSFRDVRVSIQPNSQMQIFAQAILPNGEFPVALSCTVAVERRRRLRFQNPQFLPAGIPDQQQGLSQLLTSVLAEILDNMVDLDKFNLDGVTLRINRLETEGKKLIFSGYAEIAHIPNNP
jgi:hypothetical protein